MILLLALNYFKKALGVITVTFSGVKANRYQLLYTKKIININIVNVTSAGVAKEKVGSMIGGGKKKEQAGAGGGNLQLSFERGILESSQTSNP